MDKLGPADPQRIGSGWRLRRRWVVGLSFLDEVAGVARLGVQGVDGACQVLIIDGVQQRGELRYLVGLRADLAQSSGQRVMAHGGQYRPRRRPHDAVAAGPSRARRCGGGGAVRVQRFRPGRSRSPDGAGVW